MCQCIMIDLENIGVRDFGNIEEENNMSMTIKEFITIVTTSQCETMNHKSIMIANIYTK